MTAQSHYDINLRHFPHFAAYPPLIPMMMFAISAVCKQATTQNSTMNSITSEESIPVCIDSLIKSKVPRFRVPVEVQPLQPAVLSQVQNDPPRQSERKQQKRSGLPFFRRISKSTGLVSSTKKKDVSGEPSKESSKESSKGPTTRGLSFLATGISKRSLVASTTAKNSQTEEDCQSAPVPRRASSRAGAFPVAGIDGTEEETANVGDEFDVPVEDDQQHSSDIVDAFRSSNQQHDALTSLPQAKPVQEEEDVYSSQIKSLKDQQRRQVLEMEQMKQRLAEMAALEKEYEEMKLALPKAQPVVEEEPVPQVQEQSHVPEKPMGMPENEWEAYLILIGIK